MKVALLINDTTDWCHWGSTGTSHVVKDKIKQAGYHLESLTARMLHSRGLAKRPADPLSFSSKEVYKQFRTENSTLISKIEQADIIVVNGEGTLHGITDAPLNILYLIFVSKVFHQKPVIIINHSVFPESSLSMDNQAIIALYQMCYQQADYIVVREPYSLDLLSQLGVKAGLGFDCLPLYIRDHYQGRRSQSTRSIVVAGSAGWARLRHQAFFHYLKEMSKQGYHINILIGSSPVGDADSVESLYIDDDSIVSAATEYLPSDKWSLVNAESLAVWLNTIQNADLLLSGRFHHLIAAICFGVPLVALTSNTPKIDGLMQLLELPAPIPCDSHSLSSALQKSTKFALRNAEEIAENHMLQSLCIFSALNFNFLPR